MPAVLCGTGLGMAGINDVTGAVFTAAALAGNTQFKLDVVKAFAF